VLTCQLRFGLSGWGIQVHVSVMCSCVMLLCICVCGGRALSMYVDVLVPVFNDFDLLPNTFFGLQIPFLKFCRSSNSSMQVSSMYYIEAKFLVIVLYPSLRPTDTRREQRQFWTVRAQYGSPYDLVH
jgi:hypothetical protein